MGYTENEIMELCEKAIKDPKSFYNFKKGSSYLLNYRSKTTDTNIYCTEVIAKFLLRKENICKIKAIEEYDRTSKKESYKRDDHKGQYPDKKNVSDVTFHNREKIIAIDLFNQSKEESFDYIGKILDYQTPLKAERKDNFGEIDLLAVNDEEKKVYFLELKKNKKNIKGSPETLLRCILEAYTYYKLVKKDRLLEDFGLSKYNVEDIVISPLVFKEDKQHDEWLEIKNNKSRKYLAKLIKELDVKVEPFFLEPNGKYKYKISKE
jgi:hypothetical protein